MIVKTKLQLIKILLNRIHTLCEEDMEMMGTAHRNH